MTAHPNPDKDVNHLWVRDIREEDSIRSYYLVKQKKTGKTRRGEPFISMVLGDRTGEMEAKIWERADEWGPLFREGDVIEIEGAAVSYRNQLQITVSGLEVLREDLDPTVFVESTARNPAEMMGSLKMMLRGINDVHLKALGERFVNNSQFVARFQKAPAAKNFHHCYLGGLLEHTLSVCELSKVVSEHYPQLDQDLLLTSAFLHDIGKIRELKYSFQIDYTDEGRLLGHVVLGAIMVEETLAGLKGFPKELAMKVNHMILSHHGQYEFGSPKRPKFLEAFALHLIDDLDAKMNGLFRFMERDRQEGSWTDFSRLFDRFFLKGEILPTQMGSEEHDEKEERQGKLFSP